MSSTRISCHINAPRADVYRALLDPLAVAKWKVPDGMNCHVHAFDSREGGSFRISLTDDEPSGGGKTTARTDARGGTDLLAVHAGLPRGLSPADNETGWRMAPAKLATLVEAGYSKNAADQAHLHGTSHRDGMRQYDKA
jgi:uncharacterized protein YndB with AHSA1/START domain